MSACRPTARASLLTCSTKPSTLASLGASPSNGEYAVQRAYLLVLLWLETDQDGRRPCREDLKDKSAFLNYLRGIISSVIHGMTVKRGFEADASWDDELPIADASDSPALHAGWVNCETNFFAGCASAPNPGYVPRLRHGSQYLQIATVSLRPDPGYIRTK